MMTMLKCIFLGDKPGLKEWGTLFVEVLVGLVVLSLVFGCRAPFEPRPARMDPNGEHVVCERTCEGASDTAACMARCEG